GLGVASHNDRLAVGRVLVQAIWVEVLHAAVHRSASLFLILVATPSEHAGEDDDARLIRVVAHVDKWRQSTVLLMRSVLSVAFSLGVIPRPPSSPPLAAPASATATSRVTGSVCTVTVTETGLKDPWIYDISRSKSSTQM